MASIKTNYLTDPIKQRNSVLLIHEYLKIPGAVTKNQIDEALYYIDKLRLTPQRIDDEIVTNFIVRSTPEVSKIPPGYETTKEKQIEALKSIKPNINNPSKLAKLSNSKLNEVSYYAKLLGNKSVNDKVLQEKLRRVRPPFRPPEFSRPTMPNVVKSLPDKFIGELMAKIYIGSDAEKHRAYQTLVDVFLTDWVNREGFTQNGQKMMRTPFFDNATFLVKLQTYVENYLSQCKEPGYSLRKSFFTKINSIIAERLNNLIKEEWNKTLSSNGGRTQTRRRRAKRRHTQRK